MGEGSNQKEQEVWDLRLFATLQEDHAEAFAGSSTTAAHSYHTYCTRRLSRLRHHGAVRTQLVHNPRYVSSSSSTTTSSSGGDDGAESKPKQRQRRHGYASRMDTSPLVARTDGEDAETATAIVPHPNYVWNLVYQAQRCGAQARELTTKSHVRRRLQKATKYAQDLCAVAKLCTTDTFRAECQAYLDYSEGQLKMSKHDYSAAARHYQSSIQKLQQLCAKSEADHSPQAIRWRDVWSTWSEGTVRPLLRYCQYESNETLIGGDEEMLSSPASKASPQKQPSLSVAFVGLDISLEGLSQLSVLYLKLQDSLDTSVESEEEFVRRLDDLDAAHSLVQAGLKEYADLPDGPAVLAKRKDLQALDAYFSVLKLECQRQHQERMLLENKDEESTNHREASSMVHAYATLLSLVQSALDTAAEFAADNDDDWLLQLTAHVVRLRTHRLYWLSLLYLEIGTPAQVMQLVQLGQKLRVRAIEEVQASELDEHVPALEALEADFVTVECRAQIGLVLEDMGSGIPVISEEPLWQRDLDVIGSTSPGTMTLEPTPIPPKHVSCDVAGSLLLQRPVDWTAIDEAIQPPNKRSGLFGWF